MITKNKILRPQIKTLTSFSEFEREFKKNNLVQKKLKSSLMNNIVTSSAFLIGVTIFLQSIITTLNIARWLFMMYLAYVIANTDTITAGIDNIITNPHNYDAGYIRVVYEYTLQYISTFESLFRYTIPIVNYMEGSSSIGHTNLSDLHEDLLAAGSRLLERFRVIERMLAIEQGDSQLPILDIEN